MIEAKIVTVEYGPETVRGTMEDIQVATRLMSILSDFPVYAIAPNGAVLYTFDSGPFVPPCCMRDECDGCNGLN